MQSKCSFRCNLETMKRNISPLLMNIFIAPSSSSRTWTGNGHRDDNEMTVECLHDIVSRSECKSRKTKTVKLRCCIAIFFLSSVALQNRIEYWFFSVESRVFSHIFLLFAQIFSRVSRAFLFLLKKVVIKASIVVCTDASHCWSSEIKTKQMGWTETRCRQRKILNWAQNKKVFSWALCVNDAWQAANFLSMLLFRFRAILPSINDL